MVEYRNRLMEMGHEAIIHPDYDKWVTGDEPEWVKRAEKEHHKVKREYGFIKWYHDSIKNSDAILVLNFDKNGVKNYVGGNTLMEMGFAHVNDKRVFLLNSAPEMGYREEILATTDKVINDDLTKVKPKTRLQNLLSTKPKLFK